MSKILDRYRSNFSNLPGWLTEQSIFAWDFFFSAQQILGVTGDYFEIGVYKGKSAILGALYLRPEEWCVLMDINPMPDAAFAVESFRPDKNIYIRRSSIGAIKIPEVQCRLAKCRWVHVDGDHKGFTVKNDIELAAQLIHKDGIICVDDFLSYRYPQLTAAVYRFLFDFHPQYQILFAGSNKCYICTSSAFAAYEQFIRENLSHAMDEAGINDQINKTSTSSDYGCFTISSREGERRILGLDDALDTLPF